MNTFWDTTSTCFQCVLTVASKWKHVQAKAAVPWVRWQGEAPSDTCPRLGLGRDQEGERCHRPPARAPLCPAAPGTYSSGLIQNQLLDGADDGGGRGHGRRKLGLPPQGTRPRPRVRQPPDCPKRPTEKTVQTPDTRSSQKKHHLGTKHTEDWVQFRSFRIPPPHL